MNKIEYACFQRHQRYTSLCSNRLSSTIGGNRKNGPIIHDVTSVKYNKENNILFILVDKFPKIK